MTGKEKEAKEGKRKGAKVAEWKKKKVLEIKKMLLDKPVIGIINTKGLPSAQFQEIRKKLRGKADIRIHKKNLIIRAIDDSGNKGLKKLEGYIEGPCGIIASSENPFLLYKSLKQSRSKAPAKPGMVATDDIVVPAGDTDIPVGPTLSELKMAKIDVRIDKGKIVVNKDSLVTKKGEQVTESISSALSKLGITPIEVGLEVNALYEGDGNGVVYTPDVLDIDEVLFMQNLKNSYLSALNLSVNAGYPNRESVKFMIQKAFGYARNLALNSNILTKETAAFIVQKAGREAAALKSVLSSKGY